VLTLFDLVQERNIIFDFLPRSAPLPGLDVRLDMQILDMFHRLIQRCQLVEVRGKQAETADLAGDVSAEAISAVPHLVLGTHSLMAHARPKPS
jgi:hypothetical protein